jgi:hypothetical protein
VTFDYPGDGGSRTVAWPDGTSGSHLLDASPTIPTAHSQAQCSFTQIRERSSDPIPCFTPLERPPALPQSHFPQQA